MLQLYDWLAARSATYDHKARMARWVGLAAAKPTKWAYRAYRCQVYQGVQMANAMPLSHTSKLSSTGGMPVYTTKNFSLAEQPEIGKLALFTRPSFRTSGT